MAKTTEKAIRITGAAEHNLKYINLSIPRDKMVVIEAIGRNNFVEGPAISSDEKELYYHKLENNKFRLFKVTRQNFR